MPRLVRMMKKTRVRKSRWTVPLRGKIKCRALKGACHEILHPLFFLDSNPPRPLINRLKYSIFKFGSILQRYLILQLKLNKILNPLCASQHEAWLCGMRVFWEMLISWLCSVMHILKLDSVVWCRPRSLTLPWLHRIMLTTIYFFYKIHQNFFS